MAAVEIDWDGRTYSTDDLTGHDILALEDALSLPWSRWRPTYEAKHAVYLLAVFLRKEHGEEAVEQILESTVLPKVSMRWLNENVRWVEHSDLPVEFEDGLPDPKAGEAGTTSSP